MSENLKLFFGIFILLLFVSCNVEESSEQQNLNSEIIQAKSWFESNKNNYNDPVLEYIKEIQWEKAIYSEGNES